MRMKLRSLLLRARQSATMALLLAKAVQLGAQAPEDQSLISKSLSDKQLVEFSKSEVRFAAEALPLVQGRICVYAEAAETSHGQPFVSELRIPRAVTPPRS